MSQPTPAPPPAAKPVSISKLADLIPKQVTAADCLSPGVVEHMWNRLYREAGVHTGGEDKKMSLRLWVYMTCAINGTSRVGEYSGTDILADGTSVEVAIIPRVCARDIRKFLRSNMKESTKFLKETGALEAYPRFVAKAIANGGNATNAWAMSDWMDNNPEFSPAERTLHETVYRNGIARARVVRNGLSLEEVEGQGRTKAIHANGADVHDLGRGEIVDF